MIVNYFKIEYSNDNIDFINSINIIRNINNLNKLIIDYKIPNFIVKGSTEIILSSNNIIKLSDIKYVIKLNKDDDFKKIKEHSDIIHISMETFFNKIYIIQQNNIKYIILPENFDNNIIMK